MWISPGPSIPLFAGAAYGRIWPVFAQSNKPINNKRGRSPSSFCFDGALGADMHHALCPRFILPCSPDYPVELGPAAFLAEPQARLWARELR